MFNRLRKINSSQTSPSPVRAFGTPMHVGAEFDNNSTKTASGTPLGLVIATDNPPTNANRVVYPATQFESELVAGANAATASFYGAVFTAAYPIQIISVTERHETASSAGTVDVKKAVSGTSYASGVSVLSAPLSTSGVANTNQVANATSGLNATLANLQLNAGDTIALVAGGTLTGAAGVVVTVEFKALP